MRERISQVPGGLRSVRRSSLCAPRSVGGRRRSRLDVAFPTGADACALDGAAGGAPYRVRKPSARLTCHMWPSGSVKAPAYPHFWFPASKTILCGDFNAQPDSDEIRFLSGFTVLEGRTTYYQDAWRVAGEGTGLHRRRLADKPPRGVTQCRPTTNRLRIRRRLFPTQGERRTRDLSATRLPRAHHRMPRQRPRRPRRRRRLAQPPWLNPAHPLTRHIHLPIRAQDPTQKGAPEERVNLVSTHKSARSWWSTHRSPVRCALQSPGPAFWRVVLCVLDPALTSLRRPVQPTPRAAALRSPAAV